MEASFNAGLLYLGCGEHRADSDGECPYWRRGSRKFLYPRGPPPQPWEKGFALWVGHNRTMRSREPQRHDSGLGGHRDRSPPRMTKSGGRRSSARARRRRRNRIPCEGGCGLQGAKRCGRRMCGRCCQGCGYHAPRVCPDGHPLRPEHATFCLAEQEFCDACGEDVAIGRQCSKCSWQACRACANALFWEA